MRSSRFPYASKPNPYVQARLLYEDNLPFQPRETYED